MYEVLVGESCYTASEQQKLLHRVNEKSPTEITKLSGHWIYYIHLDSGLDEVKQLLHVSDQLRASPSNESGASVDIHITPRNISPWSSQATSIAHICGLKNRVWRIERGRVIHVEFQEVSEGELALSFRDAIYDRMTENISLKPPVPDMLFTKGDRSPLVVVDIFSDGRTPISALQEYNKQMGLGLDQPNMEYLVAEYMNLGRPPTYVNLRVAYFSLSYLSLITSITEQVAYDLYCKRGC